LNQEEDSSVKSDTQERQTAYVVTISQVSGGDFVKGEGWNPSFVVFKTLKISRVNLMGVVISNDSDTSGGPMSLMLDDGTGSIEIRSFEPSPMFKRVNIGKLVNIIGRIRQFENKIFIFPEIITRVDNQKWLDYRNKQMEVLYGFQQTNQEDKEYIQSEKIETEDKPHVQQSIIDEEIIEDNSIIIDVIHELDKGDGAEIEEIKKATGIEDIDKQLNVLKERGDVFEVRPGRVKVLE
jgi:RPA family protein